MGLAFCHILANTYFPVLESGLRAALDWKHDGAARCQWQRKRREGTASKGAVGVGFSPDAPRPLRSRREGRSAVQNRRAASLPLASLVVHWAFASLIPALRALRLRLPGSNKQKCPRNCVGISVCQVWLFPTRSCLNPVCAQRLTGNGRRGKPVRSRKRSCGSFSGANGLTFMAAPSTAVCRQRRHSSAPCGR